MNPSIGPGAGKLRFLRRLALVVVLVAGMMPAALAQTPAARVAELRKLGLEYVDTGFENASPLWYELTEDGVIRLNLVYDHERGSPNRAAGHLHIAVVGRPGSVLPFEIAQLDNVWNGMPGSVANELQAVVVSEDGRTWRSMATTVIEGKRVRFSVTLKGSRLWVARVEPYRLSDLERFLTEVTRDGRVDRQVIGRTVQGRELEILGLGRADAPHRVFLRSRAHPWEAGGNWVVEGLVRRLLQGDAVAQGFLKRHRIEVLPLANKDGVALGRTRFNVLGMDLNRNWDRPADPELAPENAALEAWLGMRVRQGLGPRLAMELHNDGRGLLHISRPEVPRLQEHLDRMDLLEKLLRRHTWFTEGSTRAEFRNPGSLGDGWLERFGIDAVIHEFNCHWIAGLQERPLGRHWSEYGARLVTVLEAYFRAVSREARSAEQ